MAESIDARCNHPSCQDKNHYVMDGRCANCQWTGYVLIRNGHTKLDVRGTARCPRCDCREIIVGAFVEGNGFVA